MDPDNRLHIFIWEMIVRYACKQKGGLTTDI